MRGSKPIISTLSVLAVLVLAAAGIYVFRGEDRMTSPQEVPSAPQPTASLPQSGKDVAGTSTAQPAPAPASEATEAGQQESPQAISPPSFDVARIEPDGNGVLAGRAEPDWRVAVENGATSLAETKADGEGAWAVVLDKPLSPGHYHLSVKETSPDGSRSLLGERTIELAIAGRKGSEAVAEAGANESAAPAGSTAPEGRKQTEASAPTATAIAASGGSEGGALRQKEDAGVQQAAAAAAAVKAPKLAARLPIEQLAQSAARSRQVAGVAPAPSEAASPQPGKEAELKPATDAASLAQASPREAPAPVPEAPPAHPESLAVAPAAAPPVEAANPKMPSEAVPAKQSAPELASAGAAPVAAAPPSPEVPRVSHPKSYSVLRGDTLWDIAETYLGGGWHYRQIAKTNRGLIRNPNRIYPDQTLDLPQD